MTALLIAVLILVPILAISQTNTKKKMQNYRASNRGSRAIELEEWDKWSKLLFREYKELTNLEIDFPALRKYDTIAYSYAFAFSRLGDFPRHQERWRNLETIEILRVKHKLPTNDELGSNPYYKSLFNIMHQCVRRAVHERGYKYGGTDYEKHNATKAKRKETESAYPWLSNDPTKQKEVSK